MKSFKKALASVLALSVVFASVAQAVTTVRNSYVEKSFTPYMYKKGSYSTGKQIGILSTITGVPLDAGGVVNLAGVRVYDLEKKFGPVDLLFFKGVPNTVTDDGGTFGLDSSADVQNLVGYLSIPNVPCASSSATTAVNCQTSVNNQSVTFVNNQSLRFKLTPSASTIYVAAVARGTVLAPTAVSSLQMQFIFQQD